MTTLIITSKGRITLPEDVLKHLGIARGGDIEAELHPGGRIILRAERPRSAGEAENSSESAGQLAGSLDKKSEFPV
ncbi:AbrB/MazE/SpoVT family DNA-binding domain-containing protein [Aurantimonas marianensis]|uniref:AbrB/MazE/SpoVT family DNA-binding domain-containing protein n=1 Tax=Aurantimonas marianensis TaxID=2920428 RepID=UPI003C2F02C6